MGNITEKINWDQLKWGVVIGVITVGLIIASFLFGKSRNENTMQKEESSQETVVIDEREVYVNIKESCAEEDSGVELVEDKEIRTYCVSQVAGETAFKVLEKLSNENKQFTFDYVEYDFGALVNSINNYHPDTENKFWAFYVNEKQAEVGVSDYKVQTEDKLGFKVESL